MFQIEDHAELHGMKNYAKYSPKQYIKISDQKTDISAYLKGQKCYW